MLGPLLIGLLWAGDISSILADLRRALFFGPLLPFWLEQCDANHLSHFLLLPSWRSGAHRLPVRGGVRDARNVGPLDVFANPQSKRHVNSHSHSWSYAQRDAIVDAIAFTIRHYDEEQHKKCVADGILNRILRVHRICDALPVFIISRQWKQRIRQWPRWRIPFFLAAGCAVLPVNEYDVYLRQVEQCRPCLGFIWLHHDALRRHTRFCGWNRHGSIGVLANRIGVLPQFHV